MQKSYSTDWLGSTPIFYNEKTAKVSKNINEIIDFKNLKIHPEGLVNYLKFGYSVFGQTPVKDVKFLMPSQKIQIKNKKIKITKLKDTPVLSNKNTPEKKVLKILSDKINKYVSSSSKDIVLPLSGGYDSRILAELIKDSSKINAFTYGLSPNQSKSFEVVNAREIAKRKNIKWKQIELGDYNKKIEEWISIYGPSCHAHGMYQIEFYEKIKKMGFEGAGLISGIVGDAWAGNVPKRKIRNYKDIDVLGYSHGISIDEKNCKIKTKYEIKKKYFEENKDKLKDWRWQIIRTIQMKMMLLSYLVNIPKIKGFNSWSPFLDQELVLAFLNIKEKRKKNRVWQKEFLRSKKIPFIRNPFKADFRNSLNFKALRRVKLRPLDKRVLSKIFEESYIEKINREISKNNLRSKIEEIVFLIPKFGKIIQKENPKIKAYFSYLIIRPIEEILIKSEEEKN